MKVIMPVHLCKQIVLPMVILFFLGGILSAVGANLVPSPESHTLKISMVEPEIQYYRYQVKGDLDSGWITSSIETPYMSFSYEAIKDNELYVQQSYNGVLWSETSAYRYDEVSATWIRVQIQEKATPETSSKEGRLSLDAEIHAIQPFGSYDEYLHMGLGGKLQLNKIWANNFVGGAAVSYTYGISETPRVEDFHKIQILGIAGYEMILHPSISLIPELGVGALLHMPVGTVFVNGDLGLHYFLDFVIEAGLKISFHLGKTIQIYTAPRFKVFVESDSLGMLGEVSIGTRVSL